MIPGLALALPFLRKTWESIAPAVMITGFYVLTIGGTFWMGYTMGSTATRAEAYQQKADTLTAQLDAQREVADQLAKDRVKLAEVVSKLDRRQQEIRAVIREKVKNENLGDWYQADANSVERIALYGLPPNAVQGNASPDLGYQPDPAHSPAVPGRAGQP